MGAGEAELDDVLDRIADELAAGRSPPEGSQDSYIVFIPKGEHHDDEERLVRVPAQLRPMTLMQCSAKLTAAAANQALSQWVVRTVCGQQRGFVPGRSILDNIVELEGGMLEHSMAVGTLVGGWLLDFASAFPSVSHAWLFTVLPHMRIPAALLRIIRALYTDFSTTAFFCGQPVAVFPITTGIKAGLPTEWHTFRFSALSVGQVLPCACDARECPTHGIRRRRSGGDRMRPAPARPDPLLDGRVGGGDRIAAVPHIEKLPPRRCCIFSGRRSCHVSGNRDCT